MVTQFGAILEEFEAEIDTIKLLVQTSVAAGLEKPRTRIAGANASVLLLAATFEEFVRQMARAFAQAVVERCETYERLPPKLAAVAWKRTMEAIGKIQLNPRTDSFSREGVFAAALKRLTVVYEFCKGDLTQDVYSELIHNENNMRPQELNSLFKLSGLTNVCLIACTVSDLRDFLSETDQRKAHVRLIESLEDFFDRRNQVAHSINAMSSSGADQINVDIELLAAFGRALAEVLEKELSNTSQCLPVA